MDFKVRELPEVLTEPGRVDWEETSCHLCGGSEYAPLVEAQDHRDQGSAQWFLIVQCQDCGLCFTNPRPSALSIDRFYADDYEPHQERPVESTISRWWSGWGKNLRRKLPIHGQGRLLDFGCGSGSFLARMSHQGWKVTGLDSSPIAVDRIRDRFGLDAVAGSLPHARFQPRSFDVITMWQSLEHVHQPMQVLKEAYRLLAPGGQLIVTVPNIDSLPFRWFGQAWCGLDLPRHLTHFAPWTLRLMLHRAGFKPGPIRMVRRSSWIRDSIWIARNHFPETPFYFRWLRSKTASNALSWYSYLTRQSDCMMVTAIKK